MSRLTGFLAALMASSLLLATGGCGRSSTDSTAKNSAEKSTDVDASVSAIEPPGDEAGDDGGVTQASYTVPAADPAKIALAKLQPLQVLVGTWRGVTARSIGGAKALEDPQWSWDFLSDSISPALVLTSKTSPYLRKARLTYVADRKMFQLKVADAINGERIFEGNYTQSPQDAPGSNGDMQRSFKMRLAQVMPASGSDELIFSQDSNDRYVMEIHRMTEAGELQYYDSVNATREGAPVSIEPEKFGKQRCLVSGGMGAIPVKYAGKTFHVCCEGCKAAFEANPRRWIAAASETAGLP